MAYGGNRVGNSDPGTIISSSTALQEFDERELLQFYHEHDGTIGALAVFSSVSIADPKIVFKMSDRLQHPIPTDDPTAIEVINVLSSNVGFYDDRIQDTIEQDPIAMLLHARKDDVPADAKTWRLRRSLIAIALLQTLVDCTKHKETR